MLLFMASKTQDFPSQRRMARLWVGHSMLLVDETLGRSTCIVERLWVVDGVFSVMVRQSPMVPGEYYDILHCVSAPLSIVRKYAGFSKCGRYKRVKRPVFVL